MNDNSYATIDVDYKAMSISAIPHYSKEVCHVTVPVLNTVREGLHHMDEVQEEAKTIKLFNALLDAVPAAQTAYKLHVHTTTPVTTPTALGNALGAHRYMAKGESELVKGVDQVLGGKNSPNLIRIPIKTDGTLDIDAMKGSILDPTVKWLTYNGVRFVAPLYAETFTVLDLYHKYTPKGEDEKEIELEFGFYFDAKPYMVTLDSLVKKTPNVTAHSVWLKGLDELTHQWDKKVLGYREGWVRRMVLHVRVDVPHNHFVVDRKTAEFIAKAEGCSFDEVSGRTVDLGRYPMVNSDCNPEIILRVLKQDNVQQHGAGTPELVKNMGGDNDGDQGNIHKMRGKMTAANNPLLAMLALNRKKAQDND